MTIQVYATEQRTMVRPGQPPLTIIREVTMRNGRGSKSVRVLRGRRVVSNVSEVLKPRETRKMHKRKYIKGLYKKAERRTMKRLRGRDI